MRQLFFCALTIFLMQSAIAEETKEIGQEPGLVDRTHKSVGNSLLFLTNSIDQFFGEKKADDYANGSRLRAFYNISKREYNDLEATPNFKIRLVFPQLQDRLKFKYSSNKPSPPPKKKEVKVEKKEEAKEVPKKPIIPQKFKNAFKWNVHFESGIRVDFPPNPFAKFRIDKNIKLGSWIIRPTQEFFWFLRDGFGETTSLNFDNSLTPKTLFRFQNEVTWRDDTDDVTFVTGPTVFHRISDKRAIAFNVKASGINRPTLFVNNYRASIDYRQNIYKKWLFFELNPAVDFPESRDFHKVYSISLQIEAVFGSF